MILDTKAVITRIRMQVTIIKATFDCFNDSDIFNNNNLATDFRYL